MRKRRNVRRQHDGEIIHWRAGVCEMRKRRNVRRQHDGEIMHWRAGVCNSWKGHNLRRQHNGEIMDRQIAGVCSRRKGRDDPGSMMAKLWIGRSHESAACGRDSMFGAIMMVRSYMDVRTATERWLRYSEALWIIGVSPSFETPAMRKREGDRRG
jgi:hypothetical protein